MQENSRREFLKRGVMSLAAVPLLRHPFGGGTRDAVTITLAGRAEDLRNETVSFGLPLPFGFLDDARLVRVVDEQGTELHSAVRSLEPWRVDGRDEWIRSLLIQFNADFSRQKTKQVTVRFDSRRNRKNSR